MLRWLGTIAFALLVPAVAHAEEPSQSGVSQPSAESEPACTAAPTSGESASAADAEERAFSVELDSFARRKAFTERLVAQRTAALFEQAIARQARAAKLQRELTERERARSEHEFEAALALYLRKRELARVQAAAGERVDTPVGLPPSFAPRPSGVQN